MNLSKKIDLIIIALCDANITFIQNLHSKIPFIAVVEDEICDNELLQRIKTVLNIGAKYCLSLNDDESIVETVKNKKYIVKIQFEAAVLGFIYKEISAGNLHIKNSAVYGDILQEIDKNKHSNQFVAEYCEKLDLPGSGALLIQTLKEELTDKCKKLDDIYNDEQAFSIIDSKKKLKKYNPRYPFSYVGYKSII